MIKDKKEILNHLSYLLLSFLQRPSVLELRRKQKYDKNTCPHRIFFYRLEAGDFQPVAKRYHDIFLAVLDYFKLTIEIFQYLLFL